ncbi:Endonuclease/exonuclease/phosphatase [Flagelloscypha sp. PMI_526]|nr:Endonuclease/exonuclease/phosphatase [Flagelloscypha sp. PMI_526]
MNAVLEHLKDEILVSDEEKESDDDDDESSSDEEDGSDGESRRQCVEASVVLLQEVHVQALDTIKENKWVQDNFIILPREATKWPPGAKYGNVTLVSRDLEVAKCSIVKFGSSMMHRAAVFVDIWMAGGTAASEEDYVLRIANVHLESMKEGTQQRPRQLEVVSQFMNEETGELSGGIIAGDMNPIEPSVDLGLPESFGFLDAWTGGERNEEGWTWGYQGGTEGGRYPQARFDKVLYLRRREYEVDEPRRVGVGLRAQNYNGDTFWASDHFGLKTTVWSM